MILSSDLMVLGIVTIAYLIFLSGIGVKMALTYLKVKNKVFIYAGISVITTALPWSGVVVFFISLVFFNYTPSMQVYFLLHGITIPIGSIIWILAILELFGVNPKRKKLLQIIFIIFWMSFEIIYLIIIFTDTTLLGTLMENKIQVDYAPFNELFLLIALTQMVVTTFWLGIKYWKSDDRRIKLRGKIITIALCIFIFAAFLEIFTPTIPVIILARIIVMVYSFLYYMGFMFPKWVERLFLS